MAQRAFAGVGLPARESQLALDPEQRVEQQHADGGEPEQCAQVVPPPLLAIGIDADQPIHRPLNARMARVGEHPGQVVAQGYVDCGQHDNHQPGLQRCAHQHPHHHDGTVTSVPVIRVGVCANRVSNTSENRGSHIRSG
ncbi:MAG: hypothetical protein QOG46_1461 [Pseudonocardiales bacterium]|nr:hypothetical protein [Pseudonocardiales bacterium]